MKTFRASILLVLIITVVQVRAGVVDVAAGGDVRAALASLKGKPGVVVLAPGEFEVSDTLSLASGQTLEGTRGLSVLRWSGDRLKSVIAVRGSVGQKVGRLENNDQYTITASATAAGHVQLVSELDQYIHRQEANEVIATDGGFLLRRRPAMLYPEGADLIAYKPVEKAAVRHLSIEANDASSAILADQTLEFSIQDVAIRGARLGVVLKSSYLATIEDCRFEGAVLTAIRVERSTAGTIRGNRIINIGQTGIFVGYGSWLFDISDNEIHGTGQTRADGSIRGGDGLSVSGAGNLLIQGNRILGANCYGIWLVRAVERTVITGNTISGGITAAIHVNGNDETTVRNTVVSGNILFGNVGGSVGANPGRSLVVAGNIVETTNGQVVGVAAGSADVLIRDNVSASQLTPAEVNVRPATPATRARPRAEGTASSSGNE